MVSNGFAQGESSPCVFYRSKRDIRVVVHGDDFAALGEEQDIKWFEDMMSINFECKLRGRLGNGARDLR
jgi:hypothetical protein